MHEQPAEPPSGLREEIEAESLVPVPAVTSHLLLWGGVAAIVGFAMVAFYTWGVPVSDPLRFRVVLNLGMVLLALGLIVILWGTALQRASNSATRRT